jgi:hypothetical protein
MKNGYWFIGLIITASLILTGPAESLDIRKTVEGTVIGLRAGSVIILSDPANKEIRVSVDPDTVYDHVQKLSDLKAGDKLHVDYQIKNGANMAIAVKKLEVEDEKGATL